MDQQFPEKKKFPKILKIILIVIGVIVVIGVVSLYALRYYYAERYQFPTGPNLNSEECKPGGKNYPCPVIEDKGKVKAANTPEAQALADKYGWEHVHVKALAHSALYEEGFIAKIHPQFKGKIGCIIFVHAGDNEGYMFVEDENLDIIYRETIHNFVEKTKNIDSELISKFYLSLH